ncbi:hypothetical protein OAF37_00710 [Rubripirellula sp.]|nr:hypothetical protein [Rubripirellula sp.]MDB4644553.1 hypothetical protein [Rubripirellula sp.]
MHEELIDDTAIGSASKLMWRRGDNETIPGGTTTPFNGDAATLRNCHHPIP